ncbi:MAG: hypothetical protein QOE24_1664, partial [Frankiales bacterium]|nr:hypothetical protein [Frankiales bacterium]
MSGGPTAKDRLGRLGLEGKQTRAARQARIVALVSAHAVRSQAEL